MQSHPKTEADEDEEALFCPNCGKELNILLNDEEKAALTADALSGKNYTTITRKKCADFLHKCHRL